jgi:UDP-galactopyranose mutase
MDVTPKSQSIKCDLVCFSHLRWDFVYQRPQHLLSRWTSNGRGFYFEEPVWDSDVPILEYRIRECGVGVVVPHMPRMVEPCLSQTLISLVDDFFREQRITTYCSWYYSPMAITWTRHLDPMVIVYDCMDELSSFRGAPPELKAREAELLNLSDVVFTGGYSLFESKRHLHHNVYPFPSSIDLQHFARARGSKAIPEDQAAIPQKRIGYAGVIDERMDLYLLRSIAEARRDWHFVMLGPVAKIDPAELPRLDNVHYLGMKKYEELPSYLAGWDAAILPFARNDATRFISPTKTPEYLAAGCPVVSTSIRDVVRPYGILGLVHIADDPDSFVKALAVC